MTVFIFGEAMLEYHSKGGSSGLNYGGDTLNTAIHLARAGLDVAYVTAVGDDPISEDLVATWAKEGINTSFVMRHPTHTLGIYAIHVDGQGERSFTYWRDKSAARDMFSLPLIENALQGARDASMLYFSLISLAILPKVGQEKLLDLAKEVRANGGKTAFDSNYRPKLWPGHQTAKDISARAAGLATIGLPTDVDERQIHQTQLSAQNIASLWQGFGCQNVLVKAGEHGCYGVEGDQQLVHYPANLVSVIDSSGAGDAFNGGFLAAHLKGHSISQSVKKGQALASWVIGQKGAVPKMTDKIKADLYS
jgi:2-dehydro-3-deoxygluconokinase